MTEENRFGFENSISPIVLADLPWDSEYKLEKLWKNQCSLQEHGKLNLELFFRCPVSIEAFDNVVKKTKEEYKMKRKEKRR
jgi:hypothetical protein